MAEAGAGGNVDGSGSNASDVKLPENLLGDIKKMLETQEYTLQEFPKDYFCIYKTFVQPSRFGLKSWIDILQHPDVAPFVEVTGNIVRKRQQNGNANLVRNPLANAAASATTTTGPGPKPGTSSEFAKPKPVVTASIKRPIPDGPIDMEIDQSKRPKADEAMHVEAISEAAETEITDRTHVTIAPQNRRKLEYEQKKINWIPRESFQKVLDFNTLILERGLAQQEDQTHIDCTYCERPILEKLMNVKDHIKKVGMKKFAQIRNDYNQFEFKNGGIFQHGAAIKMANIDALMDYALTNPKAPDGTSLLQGNELLYFVDICGGPGGYAEYFLWKKKWQAKGFGIAPVGSDTDYKLKQAPHFPLESFEPYYGGDNGLDGDGNILKPFNVSKFTQFIRQCTGERGAHVVVASASDSNDYVDEDQRELRVKWTLLSELLIALQTLRPNGHFVCRIYDAYTSFTVALLYLMYRTFESVAIYKPESSMPASSEKYMLCKWKKDTHQVREVINYLQECHKLEWVSNKGGRRRNNAIDIQDLVSRQRIRESWKFCDYVQKINKGFGEQQFEETRNLANTISYNKQEGYIQGRMEFIQSRLLSLWGVPEKTRVKPKYDSASTPELRASKLITPYNFEFFRDTHINGEELLTRDTLSQIEKPNEWSFVPVGKERGFYLCLGGSEVYKFGGAVWSKIREKVELMNNTLVYGDFVDELRLDGATSTITVGFHIIDALILGGKDVRNFPCGERFDLISKYAKSMTKESRTDLVTVRLKEHYAPQQIDKFLKRARKGERITRMMGGESSLSIPVDSSYDGSKLRYHPAGIIFMKVYKDGFLPADFRYAIQNRLYWDWDVAKGEIDYEIPDNLTDFNMEENGNMDNTKPLSGLELVCHFNKKALNNIPAK